MQDAVLKHLAALVSFDTRNPPRQISAEGGLFGYLREQLPGMGAQFRFEITFGGLAIPGGCGSSGHGRWRNREGLGEVIRAKASNITHQADIWHPHAAWLSG